MINKIMFHLAFFTTLSVVIFSLFAIIFPISLFTIFYEYHLDASLNPFEPSVWLVPIVSSNFILIAIGFAYYRKKIPLQIYKGIEFILNFEISKKTALLVGIIMLVIYIGFSLPELAIHEGTQWDDWKSLEAALDTWPSTDSTLPSINEYNTRYVKMLLLDASTNIFQNIKVLPF